MKILISILVFVVSYLIGVFGFCQIVGIFRYRLLHNKKMNMDPLLRLNYNDIMFEKSKNFVTCFTLFLWTVILVGALLLVFFFLKKYIWAVVIAYIISFVSSLNVKPDN